MPPNPTTAVATTLPPNKRGSTRNRHLWLLDPLADEPTLLVRSMFSGQAVYLDGRMVLYLADRAEPWRGVCVPMERDQHAALIADCPALAPHPQLPKWLYLPEAADTFERDAQWLVTRIQMRDPRIGIVPASNRPNRARRRRTNECADQ